MKIVIGLGNPDKYYEETRHNVGFMVVDELRKKLDFPDFHEEKKVQSLASTGFIKDEKVILLKPLTFMNLSGQAALSASEFYKIDPADIIVICDDLDTPFGQIRIRKKGGPGTHNGLKSIVSLIGTEFPRVRIGIESRGGTAPEKQETVSFVLHKFTAEEGKNLPEIIKKAAKAVITIVEKGLDKAMNDHN